MLFLDFRCNGLRGSLVPVMQSAQARERNGTTLVFAAMPVTRRALSQIKMSAVLVVVQNVVSEQPPQVLLVESKDLIEQVSAAALHPTLGDSILPRTPERGSDGTDIQRANGSQDLQAIFSIAI